VQKYAMDVWQSKKNFKEILATDPDVNVMLTAADLEEAFDPKKSLTHIDYIFKRVGLE
jgi:adenylosuccinate lyase